MDFRRWAPNEFITAWMEGMVHDLNQLPELWRINIHWWHRKRREQSFFAACRNLNPDLALWPEFHRQLHFTHLKKSWEKGTISTEVAGLLIANRNRSVGTWMSRAERMIRAGKVPTDRRRYCCAMRELYRTIAEARRLVQIRHEQERSFEKVAKRMTGT